MGVLFALVKKNLLLKRRSIGPTLLELLFPVYFAAILAVMAITGNNGVLQHYGERAVGAGDVVWMESVLPQVPCENNNNNSGSRACALAYVAGDVRVDALMISSIVAESSYERRAFLSVDALLDHLAQRNGSVAAVFADKPTGELNVVGPSLEEDEDAASLVASLAVALQGLLPLSMRTLARPANAYAAFPTVKRILWPSYFPFIFYFSMLGTLIGNIEREKTTQFLIQIFFFLPF